MHQVDAMFSKWQLSLKFQPNPQVTANKQTDKCHVLYNVLGKGSYPKTFTKDIYTAKTIQICNTRNHSKKNAYESNANQSSHYVQHNTICIKLQTANILITCSELKNLSKLC